MLRTIHLPSHNVTTPSARPSSIRIVERPALNNSTGQRLWDCAIGLTCYLSMHPAALSLSGSGSTSEPPAKRRKHEPYLQVVELGAGCGLVGIAAAQLLEESRVEGEVVCTDVVSPSCRAPMK